MGINRSRILHRHSRHQLSRRGFTLTGMLLAVALFALVLGLFVAFREVINPRFVLDRAMFSADGANLAVVFDDGHVEVFDTFSGNETWRYEREIRRDSSRSMLGLATEEFSPDGRCLALFIGNFSDRGRRSEIQIWDGHEKRVTQRVSVHGAITSLSFSTDSKHLVFTEVATGGFSVLDVSTGHVKTHLPSIMAPWIDAGHVAWFQDGSRFAVAGDKKGQLAVALIDIATNTTTELLAPALSAPTAIRPTPDGKRLVALGSTERGLARNTMFIWDGEGFSRLRSINIEPKYIAEDSELEFSPDSSTVFVRDASPGQFNLDTLLPSQDWKLPEGRYLAIAPKASLAAAIEDNQIVLYDTRSGEPTGVTIRYDVGNAQWIYVLTGFAVWILCFTIHRRSRSISPRTILGIDSAKPVDT